MPNCFHTSRADGRRSIVNTVAASAIASAMAALRDEGARWICVWFDNTSNHSTVTISGLLSHSAGFQWTRDTVAA